MDFFHQLLTDSNQHFTDNIDPEMNNVVIYKLHGNIQHSERLDTFKLFSKKKQDSTILFCTDVASRGLGKYLDNL